MIESNKKRKHQLGFELQSLRVLKSAVRCYVTSMKKKFIIALVGKFCTEIIT